MEKTTKLSHSEKEVEESIYEAVARLAELKDRELGPETRFEEDLGLNSLTVATLTFELEDRWGIAIPNEVLGDFRSIAEARDTVLEILAREQG